MIRHRLTVGGAGGAAIDAAASPAFHHLAPDRAAKAWPPTWITSSTDHREHAIADEALAVGVAQGCGIYQAMCGAAVTPAALTTPPGRRCQPCCAEFTDPHRPQNRRSRVAILRRHGPRRARKTVRKQPAP